VKYTSNYNLKKPEGTDIVNIDDLNDNADILDQKLKEIENKADETKVSKSGDTMTGILTMSGSNAINFGGKFTIAYNSVTNSLDITVVG